MLRVSTCKVRIEGENLANAIKQSSLLSKTAETTSTRSEAAKFLVSEKFFRIVSEDENQDKVIAKPTCEVLGSGTADSTFAIDQLLAIKSILGKSKEVTLGLGMNQSMVMDLSVDEMAIKYFMKTR